MYNYNIKTARKYNYSAGEESEALKNEKVHENNGIDPQHSDAGFRADRLRFAAFGFLRQACGIGAQIAESLRLHEGLTMKQALDRAIELLRTVEMPDPEHRVNCYPHQLSGGLRQRAMIAIALACSPKV